MTTPFEDLTDDQKAALTDAEIGRYKNLAAAEDGWEIPGPQPLVFQESLVPPDVIVYKVGGHGFMDRSIAEKVRDFLIDLRSDMVATNYDYSVGYDSRYVEVFTGDITVTEESAYSVDLFNKERTRLSTYKQRKDAATKAMDEWKKTMKVYEDCCAWINEEVTEAQRRVAAREDNQRRFDEYLDLADGDTDRAWAFFVKAGLEQPHFRPVGAPV